jgi:hypothetical protein
MPVNVHFEDGFVHAVLSDPFTFEETARAYHSTMQKLDFALPVRAIIDVRQVNRSVSTDEIYAMVNLVYPNRNKFSRRSAIVCQPNSLTFALSRMFCAIAECHEMDHTLFDDFEAARTWVTQRSSKASS